MQDAVHNVFGYGKAPTPGEWDTLLKADFSIKAELFENCGPAPGMVLWRQAEEP